jgi:hypothetical protein
VSNNAESKFFRWPHSLQKIFQYCAEQIGRLNDLMVAPKSHIFCHLFDLKLHCFWSFNMIVEYSLADSFRDLPSPYSVSGCQYLLMSMSLQSFDFSAC